MVDTDKITKAQREANIKLNQIMRNYMNITTDETLEPHERLRKFRKYHEMNLYEFAHKLAPYLTTYLGYTSISPSTIHAWESGARTMKPFVLLALQEMESQMKKQS